MGSGQKTGERETTTPSRPDRPTVHSGPAEWAAKPGLARLVRWSALILPPVLSFIGTAIIARRFPIVSTPLPAFAWWVCLFAFGFLILFAAEKATRRLLPLSTLFKLSLIFPDEAPSRFGVALKTNSTRKLERRVQEIRESGLPTEETRYAEVMLELVAGLSLHDRLTRGHSERVRAYTDMIAEEMNLPAEDAAKLRWASLLHDVGKIYVPGSILNKPGRPTRDEWETLKSHTWKGDELIAPLREFLGPFATTIRNHHERWDGQGYPDGLAGEEIPLGARIVAVADAFDVMTSARSYKEPRPAHEARAEIAACAGGQFDPAVARAFLNLGLGRLRFAVGPLSWLANFSAATGTAAPQMAGNLAQVFVAVAATSVSGVVAQPEPQPDLAFQPTVEITVPTTTTVTPLPTTTAVTPTSTRPAPTTAPSTTQTTTTTTTPTTTSTSAPAPTTTAPPTTTPPTTSAPTTTTPPTTSPPTTTTTTVDPTPAPQLIARRFAEDTAAVIDRSVFVAGARDADTAPGDLRFSFPTLPDPTLGTLVIQTDGNGLLTSATFTPVVNATGTTSSVYEVCDNDGNCAQGAIEFEIVPVNDAPIAQTDALTIAEDTPLDVLAASVLANDTDPEADTLTVSWPAQPGITGNAGDAVFTPPANFNGLTSLTYEVCDPFGACAAGTVNVTVTPVDDPPVAVGETPASVDEDGTFTMNIADILANDSDVEGDPLTVVWGTPTPAGGVFTADASTVTYEPPADFSGTVQIPYEVCTTGGVCSGVVELVVTFAEVDDLPIAQGEIALPLNEGEVYVGNEFAFLANDRDPEGEPLTIVWGAPSVPGGTLDTSGAVIYTPPTDFFGTILLPYQACTGPAACSETVYVEVTYLNVDDAPDANDDARTIAEDTTVTIPRADLVVLANDIDTGSDDLTFTFTALPADTATFDILAAADGRIQSLTIIPAANYNGSFTVPYQVCDVTTCADGEINVTVTPVDDPPVGLPIPVSVPEDGSTIVDQATLQMFISDTDSGFGDLRLFVGSSLNIDAVKLPNETIEFTPAPNFSGSVSIDYDICDNTSCASSTFEVTVVGANDLPELVSGPSSVTTDSNTPVALPLDFVATDADGDPVRAIALTPTDGSVVEEADGTIRYTPPSGFTGTVTIPFVLCDLTACTPSGVGTWTVEVASPPAALTLYLDNPGVGDTQHVRRQNLSPTAPTEPLANFDTDRNSRPGLTIKEVEQGDGPEQDEHQDFYFTPTVDTTIDGNATLRLWVAEDTYDPDVYIAVRVKLSVCSSGCSRFATGDWEGQATNGFQEILIDLGAINETISAGDELRIRVTSPDEISRSRIDIAYDSVDQPAAFIVD